SKLDSRFQLVKKSYFQNIKMQGMKKYFLLVTLMAASYAILPAQDIKKLVAGKATAVRPELIQWRRYLHEHPELSNREFKTAEYIAAHLKKLGLEVQTGIAKTGVVGVLKGGMPGPVIALRADMDGLPVKERVNIPFASKAEGE